MSSILYVVNVEGALVRDGRYLLILRGEGEVHAAGTWSLPGGKVEVERAVDGVLEETLRRELVEELGVVVAPDVEYVESKCFILDGGTPVVDVVFLCQLETGLPAIQQPDEVAAVAWMTPEEVARHEGVPVWTRRSIALAESRRVTRGH